MAYDDVRHAQGAEVVLLIFFLQAQIMMNKVGRNDPCPCGSGKKYKQCCQQNDDIQAAAAREATNSIAQAIEAAMEHHQAGRLSDAEAIYREVLQVAPDNPDALHLLGVIAHQVGKNDFAVGLIGKAIDVKATGPMYCNLGLALQASGAMEQAIDNYRKALLLQPDYAEAYSNLGNALQNLGRLEEAVECYHKALTIRPNYVEAYSNLGIALKDQRRFDAAARNFEQALALDPNYAEAYVNLGNLFQMQGKSDAAINNYQKAIAIAPNFSEAYGNLAGTLMKSSFRFHDALVIARHALELNPNLAGANQTVALISAYLSDYSKIIEHSDAALNVKANDYSILENRLYIFSYHPDLDADAIFEEFVRWGDRFPAPPQNPYTDRDRTPGRRLRVGYVSPDFRRHTSRFFFEPLFANHDRNQVELFAYSNVRQEDNYTARFKEQFDAWRDIRGVSDKDAAELVRRDEIDILVDGCNHMEGDRLDVFALKPAPIQVTWLGAAWTTGLPTVDYVLFDRLEAPEGTRAREKIVRLPGSFFAYRPPEGTPEVAPLPALRNGYITFGYTGRSERLNHRLFRAWAEVLRRVPDARLILDYGPFADPPTQNYYRILLAAHGIDPERVIMRNSANIFTGLGDIDILLDSFPHNGGTMLVDALWMGLPALTLAGRPPVGRIGTSMMTNLGLEDWVARSEAEYVDKAVSFAADVASLKSLRAGMRDRMRNSPLMDEAGFAQAVESAYRMMWQRWCNGQPPADIGVPAVSGASPIVDRADC